MIFKNLYDQIFVVREGKVRYAKIIQILKALWGRRAGNPVCADCAGLL